MLSLCLQRTLWWWRLGLVATAIPSWSLIKGCPCNIYQGLMGADVPTLVTHTCYPPPLPRDVRDTGRQSPAAQCPHGQLAAFFKYSVWIPPSLPLGCIYCLQFALPPLSRSCFPPQPALLLCFKLYLQRNLKLCETLYSTTNETGTHRERQKDRVSTWNCNVYYI